MKGTYIGIFFAWKLEVGVLESESHMNLFSLLQHLLGMIDESGHETEPDFFVNLHSVEADCHAQESRRGYGRRADGVQSRLIRKGLLQFSRKPRSVA